MLTAFTLARAGTPCRYNPVSAGSIWCFRVIPSPLLPGEHPQSRLAQETFLCSAVYGRSKTQQKELPPAFILFQGHGILSFQDHRNGSRNISLGPQILFICCLAPL